MGKLQDIKLTRAILVDLKELFSVSFLIPC